MRNFWIGNVSFVSGVEQNERIMLTRVINPAGKLLARRDRAGRVVGKTKINEIDMFLWRLGNEIVFGRAWQINDAFVTAVFSRRARVTGHHVGVDIDRINRIGDRDFVLVAENIEDVPAIAFRTVGNKNLVVSDVDLAIAVIVLRNC